MHDLHLRVLRTAEDLNAIEPAWGQLWLSDPNASPFQHPAWLLPWWRQFSQPDLRVVTLSQHGQLIGLIPSYVYRNPASGARQLLLLGAGTSDYLDGIFAPACTPDHIRQALGLLQNENTWDKLILTQLRPASKLFQALAPHTPAAVAECCSRMPAVPIGELPRTLRRNIGYYRNRAVRAGALQFETAGESNCLRFFKGLVVLHNERWHERGEPGVLSDPRVLAWHREAIPLLARDGLLHFSALRLNGEIIAAMYALIDPPQRAGRAMYVYLPSFSPRHAAFSPGTLLLAQAIEQAANEGVQIIDMLRGDEPYKRLWHMEQTPTYAFDLPHVARSSSAALVEAA